MGNPPSAHPLTVDLELGREEVEAAPHLCLHSGLSEKPAAVAQERGCIELALADERLRIDGEPGLPLGPKHVASVKVLMEQHRRPLVRPELEAGRHGFVEDRRLERATERAPIAPQLDSPALRFACKQAELRVGRHGPPEPREDAGRNSRRLLVVGDRPELLAWDAALYEKRSTPSIRVEQAGSTLSVPNREGIGLVLALRVGEVDLENRRLAVRA